MVHWGESLEYVAKFPSLERLDLMEWSNDMAFGGDATNVA